MNEHCRLAAIVSADVAGYSRLMGPDESGTLAVRGKAGYSLQQRGQAGALARAIGRPEETVSDWANGRSLVDPELVVEIERITGMSRHELRPDLSRIFGGR